MKILLVEDEKHMAEALAQVLKKHHYAVDLSFNGEDGLYQGLTGLYDIIILDIMLPGKNGLEVLRELRTEKMETPVILLTAKGDTEDKIRGLDLGADDYLAKPFDAGELLARLRALSRRKGELVNEGILKYGSVELDPGTLTLRCKEAEIALTLKECQLLELLMRRKECITSKELILEKLWGFDSEAEDNHAEVYISFLRKKLSHIQADISIETKRNAGYLLRGKEHV